ncbi:nitrous oxide reductase accessory protein NosL [Sulfurihydrogenibium subterraneum]|uniref:nitrous oxide reductase accessory protein NosL n=1 Tax=Sulfurihydrogenibium subterraneum TaxID=171121 RepID=UPI00048B2478|nr:nitrous oxide reductase accessory protein NosL [Sulfurihydrogenibium subterraneum]
MKKVLIFAFFMNFILLFSCSQRGPEPVIPGKDVCEYCKMVITDIKFAAETITKTGKIYKYDSIECAGADYLAKKDSIKHVYVPNYLNPNEFLEAEKAYYLISDNLRSPMGLNVSAYKSLDDAQKMQKEKGGKIYDWEGLLVVIQTDYIPRFSNMHLHMH